MVFAVLSLIAVLGFAGVTRLTNRYREQQKALARRMYAKGLDDQTARQFERAIADFRSALSYDHDNFQYQLSLARALRDNGRTSEAEAYLVNLWERTPQDGFVNLALGRLASRQGWVDKAIQYYHNAAYGVWPSNPELNRRTAEFELIEFLLRQGARSQAQAELIALAATPPADAASQIHIAQLLAQAGMQERALPIFESAVQLEHDSPAALTGAGMSAFQLGRYRLAEDYLRRSLAVDPQNQQTKELLETSTLAVQLDPFERHLRTVERTRRLRAALDLAGNHIDACIAGAGQQNLSGLQATWTQTKAKLAHLTSVDPDTSDSVVDLISQIEQHQDCGASTPADRALLLLSSRRQGAER